MSTSPSQVSRHSGPKAGAALTSLRGRGLLSLLNHTPEQVHALLDFACALKREKAARVFPRRLAQRNIALIFEKRSTRTRCAFVTAAADEGAHAECLGPDDIHLGEKESIEDTARVLGRMFDGIQFRGFAQATAEALARHAGVPVWNGLTDAHHPTQALADAMTLLERFGGLKGRKIVYVGDGANNVANSLMAVCALTGVDYTCASPELLRPEASLFAHCEALARTTGAAVRWERDAFKAVRGADALYTDVWISMGQEKSPDVAARLEALRPYQINGALMDATGQSHTIFMHCLPAVKGNEVTADVFESARSVVFDEAENRVHTIKATMIAGLGDTNQD